MSTIPIDAKPRVIANALNWRRTVRPTRQRQHAKTMAPPRRDLPAGKRPVLRPLDFGINVAVENIVVDAARAAHGERAGLKRSRRIGSGKSSDAREASSTDHQHGQSRSQIPIGLSARISLNQGFKLRGAKRSTQFKGGASGIELDMAFSAEFSRLASVPVKCIAGSVLMSYPAVYAKTIQRMCQIFVISTYQSQKSDP